ncbi:hypothetical protein [Arthrobacter antibioticus]|uniref:hypothetical protein n=1 Tax=Arthrobacter sp. H35-MC1 TaxID=3046203 RepID=UPI0024B958C0|nr:hypothetical protein [Arthrobacter sp. H35-MC1]MDJ0318008.1 hypothetical protein [Arthrobacter sp. H35-MC1]
MTKEQSMKTGTHKKWLENFTLELRLNNFSGVATGDALASVEEFLADSHQDPEQAFGTPRVYAAQLASEKPALRMQGMKSGLALSAAGLVIFLIFSAALTPWIEGAQLLLGGLQMVCFAAMGTLILFLPLCLPFLVRNLWALIAIPLVGGASGVLSAVLTPRQTHEALLSLNPGLVLLVSAILLIALSGLGTAHSLKAAPDTVRKPLEAVTDKVPLKARWFEILTQWLFPILALLLTGLTVLTSSLA